MYDDLIKRMRLCEQFKCRECEYDKVMGCREKLNVEAADAIEELAKKEDFLEFLWNVINPNDMEQYLEMYRAEGDIPMEYFESGGI